MTDEEFQARLQRAAEESQARIGTTGAREAIRTGVKILMRTLIPDWWHPVFNALLAVTVTALIIFLCRLVLRSPVSWPFALFWCGLNFLLYCGIDYYRAWAKGLVGGLGWPIKTDTELASQPIPEPTVRHVPADGIVPDGWVYVVGVFRYEGKTLDAIVLPGKPVCIDLLRPGESIDLSTMVRLPFERARTPGGAN